MRDALNDTSKEIVSETSHDAVDDTSKEIVSETPYNASNDTSYETVNDPHPNTGKDFDVWQDRADAHEPEQPDARVILDQQKSEEHFAPQQQAVRSQAEPTGQSELRLHGGMQIYVKR